MGQRQRQQQIESVSQEFSMRIMFLGHAGFSVRANNDVVICDPWLSRSGAFAGCWAQFPENDHIDHDLLETATHLYISHIHRDHYDEKFLAARSDKFKERVQVVLAEFSSKRLFGNLIKLGYRDILELPNNKSLTTASGTTLFLQSDESPLHQDSALTIHDGTHTFANVNDCKLIRQQEDFLTHSFGEIDVLAMQFSGATFHPGNYEYDPATALRHSRERKAYKMSRVAETIRRLGAKTYLPSAGPPCFLQPDLLHLNDPQKTIFSRPDDIKKFLDSEGLTESVLLAPGDSFETTDRGVERATNLSERYLSPAYIEDYQRQRLPELEEEKLSFSRPPGNILEDAKAHFQARLESVPALARAADCILTIHLTGDVEGAFTLDMRTGTISDTPPTGENQQAYTLTLASTWMRAIIDRLISWEEFYLSFQYRLHRVPDFHNEPLNAFMWLESRKERTEYLEYRRRILGLSAERIRRTINGRTLEYSRFCPHKGEDLSEAPVIDGHIVCTRHGWTFSQSDGAGINNPCSIHVTEIK
jgi:UDP-MurNAc hydroxylase